MTGTLAFIGGAQFGSDTSHHEGLFDAGSTVLLMPTAKAYEDPSSEIDRATTHFESMGLGLDVLEVFSRSDTTEASVLERAGSATALYVSGGSPMHLRSVLKDTELLDTLVQRWRKGMTVALAAESCPVLCAHMVDTRGGAFTVGLGLVTTMTIIPRFDQWSHDKRHRTIGLAPRSLVVAGVDEQTALVRSAAGTWTTSGSGEVHVFEHGDKRDLAALPGALDDPA